MRTRPIIALLLLVALSGCNSWSANYEPLDPVQTPDGGASTGEVSFEQVDFDELSSDRTLPGHTAIGVTTFRGDMAHERPGARDSDLRRHAASVGADHVRWAEKRVGYRSSASGDRDHYAASASDVFDYLAVYYRKVRE